MFSVFTLANARSGTKFLADLFALNAPECVSIHEPLTNWRNPNLFGRPIYERLSDDRTLTKDLLARKARWIAQLDAPAYIETSHAFLKSFSDLSLDAFPDMRFLRVIRNPLETARSAANREAALHRWHFPFRHYRAPDGRSYFRWSLTGHEPIYQPFAGSPLTLFQHYLLEWMEIENRAERFLSDHDLADRTFVLESPRDLNDPKSIAAMFGFLGIPIKGPVSLDGNKHATAGNPTRITETEWREFNEIIAALPEEYLEVFTTERYSRFSWAERLQRPSTSLKRAIR